MSEARFPSAPVTDTTTSVGKAATAHSCAGKQSTERAERALLRLISAGDRTAIAKLYVLYFASLANFFLHLTARADLIEELINETMIEVWQKGTSIRVNSSVSHSIMALAYSRGQKRVAEAAVTRPHAGAKPIVRSTSQNNLRHTTSDTSWSSHGFLRKLPVEERAVLHLVYASGHSRRAVADIMNISCESVDLLLGDARLRLRW